MNGILSLIKPPGVTSHDMVGMVRGILGTKKVGHSGTLDPMAFGVLPIYVGAATRLIEYGQSQEKTYVAEGQFGLRSETEDLTGILLEEGPIHPLTYEEFAQLCKTFLGAQDQRPSSFSALKVDGKRAYELARQGQEVILPSRPITIHRCEVLAYQFPFFTIEVSCSSGTYIRSLIRDMGEKTGQGSLMTSLLRTQVGPFSIEKSLTLEELREVEEAALLPMDWGLSHVPAYRCEPGEAQALWQGKKLSLRHKESLSVGIYRLYEEDLFLGIGEVHSHYLKGKKMIHRI